ncbi:hypothetical protein J6590_071086 [Homalodisca vitripennis]|nr:hypothetical protein J6590_071086 [Homalodisca vitripennis]
MHMPVTIGPVCTRKVPEDTADEPVTQGLMKCHICCRTVANEDSLRCLQHISTSPILVSLAFLQPKVPKNLLRPVQGPGPGMSPKPAPAASRQAKHRGASNSKTSSRQAKNREAGQQLEQTMAGLAHKIVQIALGGRNRSDGSSGTNGVPVGRGNMRGKRQIAVTVTTRSAILKSKKVYSGMPVVIQANYFSLVKKTDWCLYQYRVDFDTSIDLTWERKNLLRDQKNNITCEYFFENTVLYCSYLLDPDPLEVSSANESDGSQICITIRRVGELTLGDHHYLQFFNIFTRKYLTLLDLQIINRDYYDPKAKVEVTEYFPELWPGYKTTIRQHENQVSRHTGDYKTEFNKAVIGSVVLTDYNNKKYTISDVNRSETPSCSFDRNGTKTLYVDYYKERYNIRITQPNQPLLVSKSKPRERRAVEAGAVAQAGGGDPNLDLLIPDLCRMTGLIDEMRSSFNLMRTLSAHTRIGLKNRIDRLHITN